MPVRPTTNRWLVALSTAALLSLSASATASAQAVATATPAKAGDRMTRVSWSIDGTVAPASGRIPASLVMTAPGFRLDRRAVAARCSNLKAALNECPRASRLGTGRMTIIVFRPDGTTNELAFDLIINRSHGTGVLAVADFIGVRVIKGRLEGSADGVTLTFDPLPTPPAIPGVSYAFKDVSATVGVTRTVVKRVKVKGSKKRKRKTTRYSLVRTPEACTGSWATSTLLTFPDGSSSPLDAPIACTS
jgi:hypothetical protein